MWSMISCEFLLLVGSLSSPTLLRVWFFSLSKGATVKDMLRSALRARCSCVIHGSTARIAVLNSVTDAVRIILFVDMRFFCFCKLRLSDNTGKCLFACAIFRPMNLFYSSKLMVSLLLVAFLSTSMGTVFGYAWCVGDDGHVEVSYATGDVCCGEGLEGSIVDRFDASSTSQINSNGCGSCLDFSAQHNEGVFFKRIKRVSTSTPGVLSVNSLSAKTMQSARLAVANSMPQPPPRIAQTLLAHRTVVLLN